MTVERGLKRVLAVLSVLIVAGWAFSIVDLASREQWSYRAHHTMVEAYCDPNQRSIYEVRQPPEGARMVSSVPGCYPEGFVPDRPQPRRPGESKRDYEERLIDSYLDRGVILYPSKVTVIIRHAEHRWFREYFVPITWRWLVVSVASLGLLWAAFFTARWVVRGFRGAR